MQHVGLGFAGLGLKDSSLQESLGSAWLGLERLG